MFEVARHVKVRMCPRRALLLCGIGILAASAFAQGAWAQGEMPIPDPPIPSQLLQGKFLSKMWDEALANSRSSGKPALVFNVDFVDSPSIVFRDRVLAAPAVREYLQSHFEIGLNDFSVDPPPSVGFDSLRNLGLRLSGLEKNYRVVVRPTAIMLQPDGSELGRIVNPNLLTPDQFLRRLEEIMQQKNTIASFQQTYWNDTSSVVSHLALVDKFEERSEYDSVLFHLQQLRLVADPAIRQLVDIRYSYLRLNIEGNPYALHELMSRMDSKGKDSALYLAATWDLLRFYDVRKKPDSLTAYYHRLIELTEGKEPDIYNDLAFTLANFNRNLQSADSLVDIALRANPRSPDYLDTKAFIAFMRKDYRAAASFELLASEYAMTPEDKQFFSDKGKYYRDEASKLENSITKPRSKKKK